MRRIRNITATEVATVPEINDSESAYDNETPSTGQNDTTESAGTSYNEVKAKAQTVIKAATKRRLCSTTNSK